MGSGSVTWLFREHLRAHPETAGEYARLKYELAERFPRDVDAYVEAKTSFISTVAERGRAALLWYSPSRGGF